MKASVRFLREILADRVPPGPEKDALLSASASELGARLTQAGIEVEGVHEVGAASRSVVLARVLAIEPHPTKGKLRLVTVDRGQGPEKIVCGAPNVPAPEGDPRVVLAPLGTHLPAIGMTLVPRDIGGVPSPGMLCSERELGLPESGEDGILVLPAAAGAEGTLLSDALPETHDHILDISLTPNRPDGLGHLGLARELAAVFGTSIGAPREDLSVPSVEGGPSLHPSPASLVRVELEDLERCPRYGGAVVQDVAIGPSPRWVRYLLESLGIRAISNVVDVTNLALVLFGQPMHAFDLEHVRGGRIVVRRAAEGEALVTLDGTERKLATDDLVIADAEGPTALAGVMGGGGSEIRATTRRIFFECAYFWPRGVRRASRRHGLHTESSHRFERGIDPAGIPEALAQAVRWTLGGFARTTAPPSSGGPVRPVAFGEQAPPAWMLLAGEPAKAPPPIRLREGRLRSLVGLPLELAAHVSGLARLGCAVGEITDGEEGREVHAAPPTHRPDLSLEVDLVEEIVRLHGIDRVPTELPRLRPTQPALDPVREAAKRVRAGALEAGLGETVTFAFVSPRELEALRAPPPAVRLMNPLTVERSVMRTSLLPGLFEALARARRHGARDVRLFSIGTRFLAPEAAPAVSPDPGRRSPSEPPAVHPSEVGLPRLPLERSSFAALLSGSRERPLEKPEPVDVWDAKGVAEHIVRRATGLAPVTRAAPQPAAHLHPRAAAELSVAGQLVGAFGKVHPDVMEALDLDGVDAFVVELDLAVLAALGLRTPRFAPIPGLPPATRDVALIVHEDVPAEAVERAIRAAAGELCESVRIFDVFRGESLPPEHRSLAFHVVYRDPLAATDPEKARTLTDAEVDDRHKRVIEAAGAEVGARLR